MKTIFKSFLIFVFVLTNTIHPSSSAYAQLYYEKNDTTASQKASSAELPEIKIQNKDQAGSGYTISTFLLTSDEQIEIAKKEIKKRFSELRRSGKTNLTSVVAVNTSADTPAAVQAVATEIASENSTQIEEVHVTENAEAQKGLQKLKAYFKTDKKVVTMTIVTAAVTGGATTAAMIYGDAINPSTCMAMGAFWAAVSGGYIFFNQRFQEWLLKTTSGEKLIIEKLKIKNEKTLAVLKTSGEWAKYFLHIGGWNYVGNLAVSMLEGQYQASMAEVFVSTIGEVASGAPWELAIANDTQRLKLKYPEQSERIQFYSTFANAVNEVLAQVLSVASLTGLQKPALIGLGIMTVTGSIYYLKTLVQQAIDKRRESIENENQQQNETHEAPSCRSLFGWLDRPIADRLVYA